MSSPSSPTAKPSLVGWFKNLTQLKSNESVDSPFVDTGNLLDAAITPTTESFPEARATTPDPRVSPRKPRSRRNSHHRRFSFGREKDDACASPPRYLSPSPPSHEHRLLRPIMKHRARSSSNVKAPTDLARLREQRDSFADGAAHKQFLSAHDSQVFGVPLEESVRVAGVGISLQAPQPGELVLYGSIPMVVANCGRFLKKNALEVEGIFRIGGSSKRVKELQFVFSSPPNYGRNLDWELGGYHVHDAASLLRRYLNSLPEPLVPLEMYEEFRVPIMGRSALRERLRKAKGEASSEAEPASSQASPEPLPETMAPVSPEASASARHILLGEINSALADYKTLLNRLPPTNKQVILYLLDMLNLFAMNCKANLMHAKNLAAIFQPSLLSHPNHDLDPSEYDNSRPVVEFLIQYADRLLPNLTKSDAPQGPNRKHSKSLPSRNADSEIISKIRSGVRIDKLLDDEEDDGTRVLMRDVIGEAMTGQMPQGVAPENVPDFITGEDPKENPVQGNEIEVVNKSEAAEKTVTKETRETTDEITGKRVPEITIGEKTVADERTPVSQIEAETPSQAFSGSAETAIPSTGTVVAEDEKSKPITKGDE